MTGQKNICNFREIWYSPPLSQLAGSMSKGRKPYTESFKLLALEVAESKTKEAGKGRIGAIISR